MPNSKYKIRRIEKISNSERNAFIRIAQSAFGPEMKEQEIAEHIDEAEVHYIAEYCSDIVGFGFCNITGNMLYLSGDAVHKDFQGNGLYISLNIARIVHGLLSGCENISCRTQNPRVEYSIRRALGILEIDFQMSRELLKKFYGRKLSIYEYVCPDDELNQIFGRLNADAGDGFFLTFNLL